MLRLRDSESSLQSDLQRKLSEAFEMLKEAEVIATKIRFNAVMKQIHLEVPRLEGNADFQPLSEVHQDIFNSLLNTLRLGLNNEVTSALDSLQHQNMSDVTRRQCRNFFEHIHRELPKEIRLVECAWRIRLDNATMLNNSCGVFQQILGENEDRFMRKRAEFKGYIIESRAMELKDSVLKQMTREFTAICQAMQWRNRKRNACLAFCMGSHNRLGGGSAISILPPDVIEKVASRLLSDEVAWKTTDLIDE